MTPIGPPPPRKQMCCISTGSPKQLQTIPCTLAEMLVPGPSQVLLARACGRGPWNLCFHKHLPVSLSSPSSSAP